jgi:putative signal transducing protein
MEVTREQLSEKFRLYTDEELRELYRSGDLTPLAREVAATELARRGVDIPTPAAAPPPVAPEPAPAPEIEGDLVEVARLLDPVEAEILRGRLEAEGVPAMVADTHTAHVLFGSLIGGVRVLVPEAGLERAREILKADARGDYALDDGTDVGPPTESP